MSSGAQKRSPQLFGTDQDKGASLRQQVEHDGLAGHILHYVTEIVSSHLGNNSVSTDEVPSLIRRVYQSLAEVERAHAAGEDILPWPDVAPASGAAHAPARSPAVPIDQSIMPDYLVCLEDGKHLRMLKRYLMRRYGMTPADYRDKWGLPADYPMVAPSLSQQRSTQAVKNGIVKSAPRRRGKRTPGA